MAVRRFAGRLLSAGLAGLLLGATGSAQTPVPASSGSVQIEAPWLRATPNGAKVAAGYLTVVNKAEEPDRLTGGHVPFAGRVEVHEMAMSDGIMKMRPVDGGLTIPPGGSVALKPGGYHLMFQDLSAGLKEGETVQGSLTFQKAGDVPVTFRVNGIGATSAGMHGH